MKIAGKKIEGTNTAVAVIPRPSTQTPVLDDQGQPILNEDGSIKMQEVINDIVFTARAVLDFSDFEKLCPPPEPPVSKRPGGASFKNVEHPTYKMAVSKWNVDRTFWIIIESLKATEGLEWETVNPADSTTWANFSTELETAGFNWKEINMIREAVWKANALDDDHLEAAKQRFLAGQREAAKS